MKEKYIHLAEKFIEHCKNGSIYNEPFDFKIDNIIYGTILIEHFDTLLFVTCVYGGTNATIFNSDFFDEDFDDFDDKDWNWFFEEVTEYFYRNYSKYGEPII